MMATAGATDTVLDVLDKKLNAGMITEEEHAHMTVRTACRPPAHRA